MNGKVDRGIRNGGVGGFRYGEPGQIALRPSRIKASSHKPFRDSFSRNQSEVEATSGKCYSSLFGGL